MFFRFMRTNKNTNKTGNSSVNIENNDVGLSILLTEIITQVKKLDEKITILNDKFNWLYNEMSK